jgi:hypothetical protein
VSRVTQSQIRRLRTEAVEAGDSLMAETCDLAMGALAEQHADERCCAALAECVRVLRETEIRSEG